jgi:predicted nucleotidyltransferase
MNIVERNIDRLIELCKNHKVSELYIFGSILTEKFSDKSDIDFLVQFEKIDILDRPVDLLENQAIRNPVFRKVVDRDKKLVYEREST